MDKRKRKERSEVKIEVRSEAKTEVNIDISSESDQQSDWTSPRRLTAEEEERALPAVGRIARDTDADRQDARSAAGEGLSGSHGIRHRRCWCCEQPGPHIFSARQL